MPTAELPQWHEKASGFFSSSGVKLKEARQTAGPIVEDAKEKVVDVAGRVGSLVKNRWSIIRQAAQQPGNKEAMQERIISAAASTGTLFKKGISETKDVVAVGKLKVEEVAKKTAQRSKTILTNIERRQKGVASTDVFGIPIEITVQRQDSNRPLPNVLVKCADYLVLSGLNTEYLFKYGGETKTIQQLISLFNEDWNASLPDGVTPLDVATLFKCYLASLPEPLTTFVLYPEIRNARSSIHAMRNILKKLPTVNYMTLEFVTALLLRVSQKCPLNKMDARSLAIEIAPLVIWQQGQKPDYFDQYSSYSLSRSPSKKNTESSSPNLSAWDALSEEDAGVVGVSSAIPLDDGLPTDFGAIEVVHCLIEHHNAIFTDANETVWR
ncbi:hypothetical protein ACHQM5_007260 [Ranunculus cassubicifolius]